MTGTSKKKSAARAKKKSRRRPKTPPPYFAIWQYQSDVNEWDGTYADYATLDEARASFERGDFSKEDGFAILKASFEYVSIKPRTIGASPARSSRKLNMISRSVE